jgi:hypothetical protein
MKIFYDQFLSASLRCQEGKRKPADLPRFASFPLLHAQPTPQKRDSGGHSEMALYTSAGRRVNWYFHGIFSYFQDCSAQGQGFLSRSLASMLSLA